MKLCNVVNEIFIEPIDQLRLFPDVESGETKVELHRISTSIPFYGVPDLVEVLGKMRPRSCPVIRLSSFVCIVYGLCHEPIVLRHVTFI